ncbi:hypothetical protein AC578_10870 [Pseudocercospora eumusae]|uniref:Uncharacterized protein n=1 Tax=Pseudocercospora eumusae TaxID=321146 RepID=A0A139H8W2_9PEZI|nr:hypothetical protein AC578_10870 [Pseudocercospora eumusae]
MKKSISARRVPRKVGGDDEEDGSAAQPDSAVKRPNSKSRKPSSLRQSFGYSAVDDDEDSEAVVTPKRKDLSRIAVHKNAAKRSSLLATPLPRREAEDEDERPSYSAASLQQLRDNTPSTPQDFSSATNRDVEDVSKSTQSLDLSSKFGSSLARYQQFSASSAIPSATEIAEKKARRARLAKEQQAEEYISLDPDDPDLDEEDLDPNVMRDEHGKLVLKPKDKYGMAETRLVRDDEDIMENFDEFTEDGGISLGRKAEAEAERKRRQDMATQIAEAEGATDDESDDSERERRDAYEATQTKHGSYARNTADSEGPDQRPKTPPIITPLPTLEGAIERLRKQLSDMQTSRMQKLQEMENLQREKIRLAEEEVRIQRALKETAEKFEQLRKEKGISADKEAVPAIEAPPALKTNGIRGTDTPKNQEMEDADDEEPDRPSFGGAGFGAGLGFNSERPGLGANTKGAEEGQDDEADEEDTRPAFGGLGFAGASGNIAGFGLGFKRASGLDEGEGAS